MHDGGVRLVLLCEDDEHLRFVHHVLRRLGRRYREVRAQVSPAARGAAEKWVRDRYADEVRLYRRKAASQPGIGLAVVIDADTQTVDYRHRQLSGALKATNLAERGVHERIVIWVPKRHIETWIADLLGQAANEEDDYKNLMRGADYRLAATRFVERYRAQERGTANLLPSLSRAFDETDRIA